MKNLVCILLFSLTLSVASKAAMASDTSHLRTHIRIMLPADKQGWDYYFYIEGSGKPAMALEGVEDAMVLSTGQKSYRMAHIYAVREDKSRQTNNYVVKLTGKPVFLVVKGCDNIIVKAHKVGINKYSILRNALPEIQRAPWQ